MGFMSRSVSMMRYRVKGTIEGNFWQSVEDGIQKGVFKDIGDTGELSLGWTSFEDFTDTEFSRSSYVRSTYIALGFRIDTIRVPPRILEIHLKKQIQSVLKTSGRTRLSSTERRELKERVKESLLKQILPSIQVIDVIWDTAKSTIYLGTLSAKTRERFEEHFKRCFGLSILPIIPFIRAEELLQTRGKAGILETVKSASMVP
jgi:DNA recombination-dependent growth factor C